MKSERHTLFLLRKSSSSRSRYFASEKMTAEHAHVVGRSIAKCLKNCICNSGAYKGKMRFLYSLLTRLSHWPSVTGRVEASNSLFKKLTCWVTRCRKDPQAPELSWREIKVQLNPCFVNGVRKPIYVTAMVVRGLWGGITHVPYPGDSYKMGGSLVSGETLPGNLFMSHMAQAGSRRPQGPCTLQSGSPARLKNVSTVGLQWDIGQGQWRPVSRQTLGGDRAIKKLSHNSRPLGLFWPVLFGCCLFSLLVSFLSRA